jgi:hypothetical protein
MGIVLSIHLGFQRECLQKVRWLSRAVLHQHTMHVESRVFVCEFCARIGYQLKQFVDEEPTKADAIVDVYKSRYQKPCRSFTPLFKTAS